MATPARLRWTFSQWPIYFVTATTNKRRNLLNRADVHQSFIQFARNGPDHGVWIGHYVLMPDHVHLFARFGRDSISLSIWQKSFKNTISKILRTANFAPPHWERGFFDHLIRSRESYDEKWRYVRENPVQSAKIFLSANVGAVYDRPNQVRNRTARIKNFGFVQS